MNVQYKSILMLLLTTPALLKTTSHLYMCVSTCVCGGGCVGVITSGLCRRDMWNFACILTTQFQKLCTSVFPREVRIVFGWTGLSGIKYKAPSSVLRTGWCAFYVLHKMFVLSKRFSLFVDSDTSEHDSLVTRAKHSRQKLDNLKCPGKSKGFIHVLSHW